MDAATALLVGALPNDRDAVNGLARLAGTSSREARRRRDVATVAAAIPGVLELLATGQLSAEHVAALVPVIGQDAAAAIASGGRDVSPEELGRQVREHCLAGEHGDDTARRQHAQRSLRFWNGPDGAVCFHGQLPPVEGATFRGMLYSIVDGRWRAEYPDRARHAGGHGGDTRDQRAADALLELVGITPVANAASPPSAPGQGAAARAGAATDEGSSSTAGANADDESTRVAGAIIQPQRAGSARPPKPTVVIVFDVERYQAELLGLGPIPVTSRLFDPLRADLYYAFTNSRGETLKLGRARRHPTPAQRLAVIARDRTCIYPRCNVPATNCGIHHLGEWRRDHGTTDTDKLGPVCDPHHHHVHINNLILTRQPDGSITVQPRTGPTGTTTPQRQPAAA